MEYRFLGKTGLRVSELVTLPLPDPAGATEADARLH